MAKISHSSTLQMEWNHYGKLKKKLKISFHCDAKIDHKSIFNFISSHSSLCFCFMVETAFIKIVCTSKSKWKKNILIIYIKFEEEENHILFNQVDATSIHLNCSAVGGLLGQTRKKKQNKPKHRLHRLYSLRILVLHNNQEVIHVVQQHQQQKHHQQQAVNFRSFVRSFFFVFCLLSHC